MPNFAGTHRQTRRSAVPLEPVIDPAGWEPEEIARSEDWAYRLTPSDIAEIEAAVGSVEKRGLAILDMARGDFPLPRLGDLLADIRSELLEGRGFVYLRGLPVADLGPTRSCIAYFGLGLYFGNPVPQNSAGHLLGHVRDFGVKYDDPGRRGYQSAAALGFHCDHADYVGLLCLRTAKSGGASRVASAVTLHNRMLAERPDLVAELLQDFYWTRHGETPPGKPPWYKQPVFSFEQGYFSARGVSSYIRKAQGLPGVPPFSETQEAAMALYRKLVEECAVDLDFREGDIQFLHNHVLLHSRRAYEDWPEEERKRHLLRLWLKDAQGRKLPPDVAENFSGVRVAGQMLQVPIEAVEVVETA